MKRRAHVLKANPTTALPTHYFFYDCETRVAMSLENTDRHVLKLGWVTYHREATATSPEKNEWLEFRSPKEFWDFIEGHVYKGTRVLLVAHNQHFDFLVVDGFREMSSRGWRMTKTILDSDIFIVQYRQKNRSILVLDNTNYFKLPLKVLGEYVGREKGEVDFEAVGEKELSEYCKRDVEILEDVFLAWVHWVGQKDLGTLQSTVAGQAFTAYRHRFMPTPIYVHTHAKATAIERESYRGGRNECLYIGEVDGPIYDLDFNSLYPSVMRQYRYPCKLVLYHPEGTMKGLTRLLKSYAVIAQVLVDVKQPVFAVRREKLIFPVGQFWATLCTPELMYAVQHDMVRDVKGMSVYDTGYLFRDYVDWCYAQRAEYKVQGNRVGDLLTKLMMNSLYGKFGQRMRRTEVLGECSPDLFYMERCIDAQTGETYLLQYFGGQTRRVIATREESYHAMAAIASHVTAYGRMILWATMLKAGLNHVFYVDTDSLFVDRQGYEKLTNITDSVLMGRLKLEDIFEAMTIHGCKDYVCDGEAKLKGVKLSAVVVAPNVYRQERFNRFASMLRRGVPEAVDIDMVEKHLKRVYDKGHVTPSGRVIPLSLSL